jgi:hypothetical protein
MIPLWNLKCSYEIWKIYPCEIWKIYSREIWKIYSPWNMIDLFLMKYERFIPHEIWKIYSLATAPEMLVGISNITLH